MGCVNVTCTNPFAGCCDPVVKCFKNVIAWNSKAFYTGAWVLQLIFGIVAGVVLCVGAYQGFACTPYKAADSDKTERRRLADILDTATGLDSLDFDVFGFDMDPYEEIAHRRLQIGDTGVNTATSDTTADTTTNANGAFKPNSFGAFVVVVAAAGYFIMNGYVVGVCWDYFKNPLGHEKYTREIEGHFWNVCRHFLPFFFLLPGVAASATYFGGGDDDHDGQCYNDALGKLSFVGVATVETMGSWVWTVLMACLVACVVCSFGMNDCTCLCVTVKCFSKECFWYIVAFAIFVVSLGAALGVFLQAATIPVALKMEGPNTGIIALGFMLAAWFMLFIQWAAAWAAPKGSDVKKMYARGLPRGARKIGGASKAGAKKGGKKGTKKGAKKTAGGKAKGGNGKSKGGKTAGQRKSKRRTDREDEDEYNEEDPLAQDNDDNEEEECSGDESEEESEENFESDEDQEDEGDEDEEAGGGLSLGDINMNGATKKALNKGMKKAYKEVNKDDKDEEEEEGNDEDNQEEEENNEEDGGGEEEAGANAEE